MNRSTSARVLAGILVLGALTVAGIGVPQDRPPGKPETDQPRPQPRAQSGFPDLVKGLRETRGCLGVETGQVDSGKKVIFAWFEDKAAAERWFYSEMHQLVMDKFFPSRTVGEPMKDVPDDIGPILVIASLTPADADHFQRTGSPIKQIAIELYTPLTGGLSLGGRLAPDGMKVGKMKDSTSGPASAPDTPGPGAGAGESPTSAPGR